jgi:hypothetical protein
MMMIYIFLELIDGVNILIHHRFIIDPHNLSIGAAAAADDDDI